MSTTPKIQIIKRKCCNTIFAACCEPQCYTDNEWLKSLKKAAKEGNIIETIEAGNGFQFSKCTCTSNEIKETYQLNLF